MLLHIPESPFHHSGGYFPLILSSQTDMPSLTTVTLDMLFAFWYKKTVHTKSFSFSSPSFLDITPALQKYLKYPLSFTLHSPIPHSKTNLILSQHQHTPPYQESLPQTTGNNLSSSTLTLAPTRMRIITWNPLPSSGCWYHASM